VSQHPLILLFVLFFGACVGSFLNVVIYRLPRDLSVNKPARSFCPSCKKQIPWYYNIPIASWILLRGKCAFCKSPIAARYVMVEGITMLLFFVVWMQYAPQFGWGQAMALWILVALLLSGTFIDLEHLIIPDGITKGGAVVGVILAGLLPLIDQFFPHLGILHTSPNTDGLPNAIWYRGLLWALFGAGFGYLLLWTVVQLGKIAFGRQIHEFDEEQNWIVHQPDADKNPRLDIGELTLDWDELFGRPSDRLVIETGKIKIHLKEEPDGPVMEIREIETDNIQILATKLQAGGEKYELELVEKIEGQSKKVVQPREAMGMGDVKFVMLIGAFLGWKATLFSLVVGAILGSIVGLIQKRMGGDIASRPMPFGPYLAIGALIFLFYGPQIILWYFHRAGLG